MGVNANTVIREDMSLDEKLAAIDAMMNDAVLAAQQADNSSSSVSAPVDPADLTMCLGCQ